jgi:hypothetical protein
VGAQPAQPAANLDKAAARSAANHAALPIPGTAASLSSSRRRRRADNSRQML